MTMPNFVGAHWQKSSRTGGDDGGQACVEVAQAHNIIGVRDTKLGTQSPILAFNCKEWGFFLTAIKHGEADFS